jgi:hypothetical protein
MRTILHIACNFASGKEFSTMTRAIQKHIARRQDQTYADWFAELRELAGESWAAVADQAPRQFTRFGAAPGAGLDRQAARPILALKSSLDV